LSVEKEFEIVDGERVPISDETLEAIEEEKKNQAKRDEKKAERIAKANERAAKKAAKKAEILAKKEEKKAGKKK